MAGNEAVTSGCLKEAVLPGQGPRPSWKGAREAGKGGPRGEEVAGEGVLDGAAGTEGKQKHHSPADEPLFKPRASNNLQKE